MVLYVSPFCNSFVRKLRAWPIVGRIGCTDPLRQKCSHLDKAEKYCFFVAGLQASIMMSAVSCGRSLKPRDCRIKVRHIASVDQLEGDALLADGADTTGRLPKVAALVVQ